MMAVSFISVFKNNLGIKKVVGVVGVLIGLGIILFSVLMVNYQTSDFVGGWDNDSLTKRVELNISAINMWKDNPIFGVGAGNFVAKLPEYQSRNKFYWLQPAHNIFLLMGTEVGLLGVGITIWFFSEFWENKKWKKSWMLVMLIVITGLADHYWITLPQNSWLLAIVLGSF